jgi:uncharacterized integral membrane protein
MRVNQKRTQYMVYEKKINKKKKIYTVNKVRVLIKIVLLVMAMMAVIAVILNHHHWKLCHH